MKNTLIIAVGRLSTQFLTFLLLPLYTTFLSLVAYGQLDLIIIYLGLLAPTFTVQMEMSVFRHLIDARKSEPDKKAVISSALAVSLVGMLVGSIVMLLAGWIFSLTLVVYVTGAFVSTVLVNFFLQVARGIGRNDIFAVASIIIGLTNIILSAASLVILDASVEGLLVVLMIANAIGGLFLVLKTESMQYIARNKVERSIIKSLLIYAWPLVPNHISLWGIGGISRTIVASTLGLAAMGIYAAASKFTLIYTSLYGIFAMSWTESVSLHLGKKGDFLSNTTNSTVKLFGSLALLIIAASAVVFPFLIAPDFADARHYVPILILGGFFASLVTHYGAVYLAAKATKKIAIITLQAVIVSSTLTFLGVWSIGLYAPALAILVTYAYIAVRRHHDIQSIVNIRYKRSTVLPVAALAIFVLIFYYIDNRILNILVLIISIAIVLAINKTDIYKIKNILLKKGSA